MEKLIPEYIQFMQAGEKFFGRPVTYTVADCVVFMEEINDMFNFPDYDDDEYSYALITYGRLI